MHFTKVANLVLNTGSRKADEAQDLEKYQSLESLCLSVDKVLLPEGQTLVVLSPGLLLSCSLKEGAETHRTPGFFPSIQ